MPPISPHPAPTAPDQCPVCGAPQACVVCKLVGRKTWSPYLVGIGLLSWVTFAAMDKALGTSTTMVHLSGLATAVIAPDHVLGDHPNSYYAKELAPAKGKPMFDWQFFLVIGLLGGAFLASRLSRDVHVERVPALWAERFGPSKAKRYVAAFLGGVILLFGARMAGGCTSGHGISGGLQLALSSWTFFIAMFASGVVTAFALFGFRQTGGARVQL